jgi:hypothetical protein
MFTFTNRFYQEVSWRLLTFTPIRSHSWLTELNITQAAPMSNVAVATGDGLRAMMARGEYSLRAPTARMPLVGQS